MVCITIILKIVLVYRVAVKSKGFEYKLFLTVGAMFYSESLEFIHLA